MTGEELQPKSGEIRVLSFSDHLNELENFTMELRGMMYLAGGYIRSTVQMGSVPSSDETEFVAFALERFGDREAKYLLDLSSTGQDVLRQLEEQKPPVVEKRLRRKGGKK